MEVILSKDIERVGKAGEVIKVKDGYAMNFLLPNGLAVLKTQGNIKMLEQNKQKKLQEEEKSKESSRQLAEKLSGLSLTISVLVKEEEKLYGSITTQEISAALKEEGIEIDKNTIMLDESIKALGIYEIPVKLHPQVSAKLKLWVVKK
ncbi:MAG: 50S ribosomal protein L9 [Candidatus Omnitrophica bacterium]|nr:50S ribosomal protein L9 [Candidatus Omnitrophota bacterium]